MNIRVVRVGSIWHGTIDERPDVDVRGLTEEIARRKIEEIARTLASGGSPPSVDTAKGRRRG